MMKRAHTGFTIIEFLACLTFLCTVFAMGCPDYMSARDKAREAEVKSNCHSIQIALERYAVDHSGEYPAQIFGGDVRGWSTGFAAEGWPEGCWGVWYAAFRHFPIPLDPLIHFDYMSSYPSNPFISKGDGAKSIIPWTGGTTEVGLGDPRFGHNGEIMGNCLNDPRYLWEMQPFSPPPVLGPEQYHIYDWMGTQQYNIAMVDPDNRQNPYYSMGGLPEDSGIHYKSVKGGGFTACTYWPGEFFYRSGGDFLIAGEDSGNNKNVEYKYIWDMPYTRINKYLLGGYGSIRTQGVDVIRLTGQDGRIANNIDGFLSSDKYVTADDFQDENGKPLWEVYLSTPECMGGGSMGICPMFPYRDANNSWLYGAPDGYRDGVIITLISCAESEPFLSK